MDLTLENREAKTGNPKFLVLFGQPKCGKTTIVSGLEKALIIDMDPSQGTDFVTLKNSKAVKVRNITQLDEVRKSVLELNEKAGGFYFNYCILDTATDLEDLTLPWALNMYQKTPMGKNYKGDVRMLPNGAGYLYIREAYKAAINMFRSLFPVIILNGHTKDKNINKEGKEMTEFSLDLSGKLERIMLAQADAVGFVYRKKKQTIINFNGGGDFVAEARALHLRGREIVIAESDENNVITTFWDKIFINN